MFYTSEEIRKQKEIQRAVRFYSAMFHAARMMSQPENGKLDDLRPFHSIKLAEKFVDELNASGYFDEVK